MASFYVDNEVENNIRIIGKHIGMVKNNSIAKAVVQYYLDGHPEIKSDIQKMKKIIGDRK